MKKIFSVLLAFFLLGTLSRADWVLATLLRIGADYTNSTPQNIRRMDFSNNVSDDMRDWRLNKFVVPTRYPALVNTRYGVVEPLLPDSDIEQARSNLWVQIARQAVVTPRQFKLSLLEIGVTPDDVEAALATIEDPMLRAAAQIEWRDASVIRRDHPLISQIAPLLGGTDELLDSLFLRALEIE